MSDTILKESTEEGILILTLNRPKAMNAMSRELIETLKQEMEESGSQANTRVIIIIGADDEFPAFRRHQRLHVRCG